MPYINARRKIVPCRLLLTNEELAIFAYINDKNIRCSCKAFLSVFFFSSLYGEFFFLFSKIIILPWLLDHRYALLCPEYIKARSQLFRLLLGKKKQTFQRLHFELGKVISNIYFLFTYNFFINILCSFYLSLEQILFW